VRSAPFTTTRKRVPLRHVVARAVYLLDVAPLIAFHAPPEGAWRCQTKRSLAPSATTTNFTLVRVP